MWTTLSVRMGLLSLAVVMLFSASEEMPQRHMSCCDKVKRRYKSIEQIQECFEQKKRDGCEYHAFVITNDNGTMFCVKPTPQWLKTLIKKGELKCPPEISKRLEKRFEVLDEDDLE